MRKLTDTHSSQWKGFLLHPRFTGLHVDSPGAGRARDHGHQMQSWTWIWTPHPSAAPTQVPAVCEAGSSWNHRRGPASGAEAPTVLFCGAITQGIYLLFNILLPQTPLLELCVSKMIKEIHSLLTCDGCKTDCFLSSGKSACGGSGHCSGPPLPPQLKAHLQMTDFENGIHRTSSINPARRCRDLLSRVWRSCAMITAPPYRE